MLEKTDEVLSELATKTQNRDTQKLYLEAKDVARTKRAEFEKAFHSTFLAEFKQRTKKGKKTGGNFATFDAEASSFELSLVADDDLEETLKFNEMASKLRRICEEEIAALDQRVGVLLGDADLQSEQNPLGPNAVCDAYKKTCRKLVESVPVRAIFLKLFDDHVADALRSIYKALNELLVANAILPKIRLGVTKKDEGKKPKKIKVKDKDGKDKADDDENDDEDEGQDVFAALQKLFASQGGGGGPGGGGPGGGGGGVGVGGAPMLAGAELLGSLTKLQLEGLAALGESGAQFVASGGQLMAGGAPITGTTNVLQELKASQVGAGMGQMDAMTLDVVALLFDQLFDDAKIPLGAKGLIGRLQIPMLKVAIADKTFFSNKEHPARMLLEKLGEIAERLPADFNTQSPLFAHLETILQELITGYQDDVEVFNIVREQLVQLMAREDQRVEDASKAASDRVLQEEALAVAKSVAQEEIRARVLNQLPPGAVLEFLAEQWLKLMVIIHVRVGTTTDAWKNSLDAMEQLIWSVQPKEGSRGHRARGARVLPRRPHEDAHQDHEHAAARQGCAARAAGRRARGVARFQRQAHGEEPLRWRRGAGRRARPGFFGRRGLHARRAGARHGQRDRPRPAQAGRLARFPAGDRGEGRAPAGAAHLHDAAQDALHLLRPRREGIHRVHARRDRAAPAHR